MFYDASPQLIKLQPRINALAYYGTVNYGLMAVSDRALPRKNTLAYYGTQLIMAKWLIKLLPRDNALAYFVQASRTKKKVIYDCDKVSTLSAIFSSPKNRPTFVYLSSARGQCNTTFYGHNLQMRQISKSICLYLAGVPG